MADDALFDESVGRVEPDTWTVGELSVHIGRVLGSVFPDDIWVQGQIRNISRPASGHVYFNLVEPAAVGDTPLAQMAVTLLAPEKEMVNRQITAAGGGVRMTDGIEVRIAGRLRWYGPRGVLQLKMHSIDPAFTLGRLQADRDRIMAALAAEGLLERNGRLPVPLVPLRLGLVTSVGSAAHADVMATLTSSGIGFQVRQVDARTQGTDSARQVTWALHQLAADGVDAILLVRGGGARTDLAAFDTEQIARAIAAMPVPVFTGIGHEIDSSIADEVAHSSFKTPTAAAAAVVDRVKAFIDRVDQRAEALHRSVGRSMSVATSRLDDRTARVTRLANRTLDRRDAVLDASTLRLPLAAGRTLAVAETGLGRPAQLVGERGRRADRATRLVDGLAARVNAHDPQLALARGWSITTTADGRLVRRLADAPPGTRLVTRVADGHVTSTVDQAADQTNDPASEEPAE